MHDAALLGKLPGGVSTADPGAVGDQGACPLLRGGDKAGEPTVPHTGMSPQWMGDVRALNILAWREDGTDRAQLPLAPSRHSVPSLNEGLSE